MFNQFKDILDHKTVPKTLLNKKYKVDYDKQVKGFIIKNPHIKLPDCPKKKLNVSLSNIILQIKLNVMKGLKIEFCLLNTKNQRKRLIFSPTFKTVQREFFHTKVPLTEVKVNVD